MLILYLFFVVLLFIPFPTFEKSDSKAYVRYLDRDNTLSIKGFFVILVFFRHFRQYIELSSSFADKAFAVIDNYSGQLIVTLFLFYSGFGIYYSIENKKDYLKCFLKNRFLPVWIDFAVCVAFFLFYDLIAGIKYDLATILLAFTGWTSIGNSTWFMFVTFVLYLLVCLVFSNPWVTYRRKHGWITLLLFTVVVVLFACVLFVTKTSVWYNTLLCFPLGMWYGFFKEKIDRQLMKRYGVFLTGSFLFFLLSFLISLKFSAFYCICSCMCFCILVVIISVRIRFRSPVFSFFGKHVFSIYILQRLCFLILQDYFSNVYFYFVISFIATVAIALIFDACSTKIKKRIIYDHRR